jgi:hypothetical protein
VFAAEDPVEDFAETYRLQAIAKSKDQPTLSIAAPIAADLVADIKDLTPLNLKGQCVEEIDREIGFSSRATRRRR